MRIKTGITAVSVAQRIINFIDLQQLQLIGLGNTNAWPSNLESGESWEVEGEPPDIDSSITNLANLIGYVPITRISPVYNDAAGDIILADGTRYREVQAVNAKEMAEAGVNSVYIEALLEHDNIPESAVDWRSYGVYTNCTIDGSFDSAPFIPSNKVTGQILDEVIYFPAIKRQSGVIETVQIIRRFT